MPIPQNEIYLGSILFEKNCWTQDREPSIQVSEWLERIAKDGYDGIDLWSKHVWKATPDEQTRLEQAATQIKLFNGYAFLEPDDLAQQDRDAQFAKQLECQALKYNVGPNPAKRDTYLEQIRAWRTRIPHHITMICECHIGSIVDTPETAKSFFEEAKLTNHGLMIHPFVPFGRVGDWLETFGPQIQHAHIQTRDSDDRMAQLTEDLPRVREAISIMKSHDYKGNYTLEFTKGSGIPTENAEDLYTRALQDRATLRDLLA